MLSLQISDFRRLYAVAQKKPSSVAIVGGGFMGSELACALGRQEGVTVTQTFPEPGNMGKVLPAYLSKWATDKVRKGW
jgi:programmed cell death 8 (apoptosis-inducing factor)